MTPTTEQMIDSLYDLAFWLLASLWNDAHGETKAESSETDLARRYGLDSETVTECLAVLEEMRLLTITWHSWGLRYGFTLDGMTICRVLAGDPDDVNTHIV